jgi:hypothetical protein
MTPSATQIGDTYPGSGSGSHTVSISWAADVYLVFGGMAHRNTSDFTFTFTAGTSGLTWLLVESQAHSTFSIGHGRGELRIARTTSAGSGTVGFSTSATCQQRGIDVWEVSGADLTVATLADVIVQSALAQGVGLPSGSTLTCPLDQNTDADNIWFINSGSIISDYDATAPFDVVDEQYTGSGGEHEGGWGTGDVFDTYDMDPVGGAGGPWSIFVELLCPQEAVEETGWGMFV